VPQPPPSSTPWYNPKKAPCTQNLKVTTTSFHQPISGMLDRSEASHLACIRRHHGARRCPLPARVHQGISVTETPLHHAAETLRHRCSRCTPLLLILPPSSNCSKNDALKRYKDTKVSSSSDPGCPDRGFPPEHHE
jgi:hypothetical protein